MKRISIALIGMVMVVASCCKGDDNLKDAVITGYDLRACACCGGVRFNKGDDTMPYSSNTLLTDSLPAAFTSRYTLKFPMRVKLSWLPDTSLCGKALSKVIITQAELR
jgi:hypothetical protein